MRPECRVASPPAGTQCSAPGTLRLRSWARTEAASVGAAVGLLDVHWHSSRASTPHFRMFRGGRICRGCPLPRPGCAGAVPHLQPNRQVADICSADMPPPRGTLQHCPAADGAGVLAYVAWNDRMSVLRQPCWAVPKGSAPFYRLIIDASFANEMYSDWGVSYTAGAQLSSTLNRCNFTSSVKCWPRGRRLSFFP